MQTRWLSVLIGNNDAGKTTLQKRLIRHLCGLEYTRLDTNVLFNITCLFQHLQKPLFMRANRILLTSFCEANLGNPG